MPAGSSPKRERQYEHIKESYQERGVKKDEAEERAARTVNKQRAEAGETKAAKRKSSSSSKSGGSKSGGSKSGGSKKS